MYLGACIMGKVSSVPSLLLSKGSYLSTFSRALPNGEALAFLTLTD